MTCLRGRQELRIALSWDGTGPVAVGLRILPGYYLGGGARGRRAAAGFMGVAAAPVGDAVAHSRVPHLK